MKSINKEEESEGDVKMITDFEYPLADEPVIETDLCTMKFPNSMKLLLYPKVWIADTGTTFHATPNSRAMVKKSEKKCSDTVTMENGKSEATEWYGDLPVAVCDMEGIGICAQLQVQLIQSHRNDDQQLDPWRG
jgi:hypothetical protein